MTYDPDRCPDYHWQYRCILRPGHKTPHTFWLDSGDFVEVPLTETHIVTNKDATEGTCRQD